MPHLHAQVALCRLPPSQSLKMAFACYHVASICVTVVTQKFHSRPSPRDFFIVIATCPVSPLLFYLPHYRYLEYLAPIFILPSQIEAAERYFEDFDGWRCVMAIHFRFAPH